MELENTSTMRNRISKGNTLPKEIADTHLFINITLWRKTCFLLWKNSILLVAFPQGGLGDTSAPQGLCSGRYLLHFGWTGPIIPKPPIQSSASLALESPILEKLGFFQNAIHLVLSRFGFRDTKPVPPFWNSDSPLWPQPSFPFRPYFFPLLSLSSLITMTPLVLFPPMTPHESSLWHVVCSPASTRNLVFAQEF